MTINLSGEHERVVRSLMGSGRFATEEDLIGEALRLLQRDEAVESSRVLDGIRQGIEDMNAGRSRPADEVFAEIRREFNLPPDA